MQRRDSGMGYFQDGVLDRAMTKFLPQINAIN